MHNIAEGAEKFSKLDKRRYYLSAAGSAAECSAILNVGGMLQVFPEAQRIEGKAMLVSVANLLFTMAKNLDARALA